MSWPAEILIPASARYTQFIETDIAYNANYDITWSFQVNLSTIYDNDFEYAFGTFLSTLTGSTSALPGHYVGDRDPAVALDNNYLVTEQTPLSNIGTEDGIDFIISLNDAISLQLIKIVFDSTGLYGLSGRDDRDGVGEHQIKKNALCIRNFNNDLVFYEHLSAFTPTFNLTSTEFETYRVRYANLGTKISIDKYVDSRYMTITSIDLPFLLKDYSNLNEFYVGYTMCTPISTLNTALSVGEFKMKHLHVEGLSAGSISTETVTTTGKNLDVLTNTLTFSGISIQAASTTVPLPAITSSTNTSPVLPIPTYQAPEEIVFRGQILDQPIEDNYVIQVEVVGSQEVIHSVGQSYRYLLDPALDINTPDGFVRELLQEYPRGRFVKNSKLVRRDLITGRQGGWDEFTQFPYFISQSQGTIYGVYDSKYVTPGGRTLTEEYNFTGTYWDVRVRAIRDRGENFYIYFDIPANVKKSELATLLERAKSNIPDTYGSPLD